MICPLCAKENKDDAKFCGNCGGTMVAGGGDVLEDVLGLGLPRSTPPGEVGSVGLDDLFNSFSKQKGVPPATPSPPAAKPPTKGRSLTIEDIISSVPEQKNVNPPTNAEEARARAAETGANPNVFGTPPPMRPQEAEPEVEAPPSEKRSRVPFDAPKSAGPPPDLVPTVFALEISPVPRGLLILVDLLLLGCVVEMGRHLAMQAMPQVGMAAVAFIIGLALALVSPKAFGPEHVGKILLLDLVFLSIWAHQNALILTSKNVFAGFGAPYVLSGTILLVFLFAGATLAFDPQVWKGARYAFGVLALACCASLVDALAANRAFDRILAGEGLAAKLPQGMHYLEPCWAGMNGLLPIALLVAFRRAFMHKTEGRTYRALSLVLTVAILFDVCRFGVRAFEASGKPGLRTALARAGDAARTAAAARGVAIPEILPAR